MLLKPSSEYWLRKAGGPFVAEFDIGVAEVHPGESAAKALELAAAQASERQAS